MKHSWVYLSRLSNFEPKKRTIRKFKNSKKLQLFWKRKGWKFYQANKIYPAGWRKTFGKDRCVAFCCESSHKSITYSFFWMPRCKAIYPPKLVISEYEKQLSKDALVKRIQEYWGKELLHLTRQQANCIDKALLQSLEHHDYKVDNITDNELDGVWELMQEIWGNGSFLSMMTEMLQDNEPKGGFDIN